MEVFDITTGSGRNFASAVCTIPRPSHDNTNDNELPITKYVPFIGRHQWDIMIWIQDSVPDKFDRFSK